MNAESVLAIMGDLYETNAQLNALLKASNEQTRLANLEIERLTADLAKAQVNETERIAKVISDKIDNGPELPFVGGSGGCGGTHVNGGGSGGGGTGGKAFQ